MPTPPIIARLIDAVATVYHGPRPTIELLVVGFLARGHVLIEDIPGVGKTTLARTLAKATGGSFRRLQCTPDLMPADVTGLSIWDEREHAFRFHAGPVFCDVLLADELNRTPPRTQSALLEAMSEGQVTSDGETRALSARFLCIATQNPSDHVGTYPLPESQRDRFLISTSLGYPGAEDELELLRRDGAEADLGKLTPVWKPSDVSELRALAHAVAVEASVRRYVLDLVHATRAAKGLVQGASPRAALGLQRAAQAMALVKGRDFVIPDDVQVLASPCLAHRIVARAGAPTEPILANLVDSVAVPR